MDNQSNPFTGSAEDHGIEETLHLNLETPWISDGAQRVNIYASNFTDIDGFQFTLKLDADAGKITTIHAPSLPHFGDANYAFHEDQNGLVTFSWHSATPVSLNADEVLFSMVVQAQDRTPLSRALTINSDLIRSEAYKNDSLMNIDLTSKNQDDTENRFHLLQNQPNPFTESTEIGFYLAEDSEASLTIYDTYGARVYFQKENFIAGYNKIVIDRSKLELSGILYYRLKTKNQTSTKK